MLAPGDIGALRDMVREVVREELDVRFPRPPADPLGAALDAWLEAHPAALEVMLVDLAAELRLVPIPGIQARLGRMLRARGWTHERRQVGGLRSWQYSRPAVPPRPA